MIELRQQASLVDEAAHPGVERLALAFGPDGNRQIAAAGRKRARHVLLDRNRAVQLRVVRQIDDAEAAFANHLFNAEFSEVEAGWQGVAAGYLDCFGEWLRRG